MKNYLITTFFLLLVNPVFNQIKNRGFEDNNLDDATGADCRNCNGCNSDLITVPFNAGNVTFWNASHGSPQLNKITCPGGEGIIKKDYYAAWLSLATNNVEGIFQNMTIVKNQSYNFSIFVYGYSNTSKVILKFTTGLVNRASGNAQITLPQPATSQLIIEKTLIAGWQKIKLNDFIADENYSQFWIYADGNSIAVDDVIIDESCCIPNKIYQNVYDPPNTHVNDYIIAGRNVSSGPQGDVTIKNKPELTYWTAGNKIELLPGFVTEPNAQFIAEILPCSQIPMEIFVTEVPNSNVPQCTRQYEAVACYGSGAYKYTWDTDHPEHLGSQKTKLLWPATDALLGITVTDLWTNETVTKYVEVKKLPFVGPINVTANNVVTPNGDGINDQMVFIDETRIGETTFGYNAFYYKFFIEKDRRIDYDFTKIGESKITGFPFDEIKYDNLFADGSNCNEDRNGTYYWRLEIKNCSHEDVIEGVLSVFCDFNAPNLENDSIKIDINTKNDKLILNNNTFSIFPNPTYNNYYVSITGNNEKSFTLLMFDLTGKIVLSE